MAAYREIAHTTPDVCLPLLVLSTLAVWAGTIVRLVRAGSPERQQPGLVYGTLTLAVIAVYLAATALVGSALDRRPLPGVVAAALVAVLLAPARDRLQRAADRLVYGARRDPLRAITRLGDEVATAGQLDLVSAALKVVMNALRAPAAIVVAPDGRVVNSPSEEPRPSDFPTPARDRVPSASWANGSGPSGQ
ncbi:hypothetical protein [Streptomyces sp. NPDC021622]|uniref:hypothetical protein n=1 Tax=Streptomyces sp. NPDC021622 TaxID=3155013 RepID=UPI0033D8F97B